MLYEEQRYVVRVGKVPQLLAAYEQQGLEILRRSLGHLVGIWTVDCGGDMDEMMQVWRFDDAADRRRRRTALAEDPEWQEFAGRYGDLITKRMMRVLVPAGFLGELP